MNQEKTNHIYAGRRRSTGMIQRLNLAPLMGRRDAVYDAVAEFAIGPCIFPQVSELLKMLNSAEKDSLELLTMLSSPDTIDRERNMLEHIRKVIRLLQVIEAWISSRTSKPSPGKTGKEDDDTDPVLITVVSRLSSLIRNASPHLIRYRAYAEKSASPSYADRYKNHILFIWEYIRAACRHCPKQWKIDL